MTGPTLSVSIATALPGKVAAPSLLALNNTGEGGPGVPGLAAFLDLMIGQQVAAKDDEPADNRQDDAAPGNSLPDQDDDKDDPALAWLLTATPLALPPVTTPALVVANGGPASVSVATVLGAPTAPPSPDAQPIAAPPIPVGDTAAPPVSVGPVVAAPQATPDAVTAPAPVLVDPVTDKPAAAMAVKAPFLPVGTEAPAAPVAQPLRVAVPQRPSVTLAAAITARTPLPALFALAQPARDDANDRDTNPLTAATTAASLLTPADAAALVAQPGEAQRQALDMGQRDWPQKMIDRIEALRDDANANDTSIRLKPEALGRIDVSLRTHADGAVSVRFTAEQPTTRSLIADAQPQLQAAAEAKGIRLSGTSVDLANSGNADGNRPRPQAELQQNTSNRLAASGEHIEAVGDGRIA